MIEFQNVSKRFGSQEILIDASLRIIPGERVGIVGPNGTGKTTIFELIADEISPDSGSVTTRKDARLGYLHQQLDSAAIQTPLLQYVENAVPALKTVEERIHTIEAQMQRSQGDRKQQLAELGNLQTRFEHLGGYDLEHRAAAALGGLGFPEAHFTRPLASFSGGWQMRAELARCLVARPDVLLLDEPSNYLDIPAVEWLQRFLREFKGTLVMISHDRYLLNSLVTTTVELIGGYVERYNGNYDRYVEQRAKRYEQRLANAENTAKKREKAERFIERFRAKATKASQVRSRVKMLERMDDTPAPVNVQQSSRIRLPEPKRSGTEVIRLEQVGATYDAKTWVLRDVDFRLERGDKMALVGLNGMGKTTLMRLIAGHMEPSAGKRTVGHKVTLGYQSQEFADTMNPNQTVLECVKSGTTDVSEQQVRSLLGGFGFSGAAVEKQVSVLSGGEKVRLAFARLLMDPPNLLLLDEPTTHLDIAARETLEQALVDYKGTLCFVSHDIAFVRRVATTVAAMEPPGVRPYVGGYDYYCEKLSAQRAATQGDSPAASSGCETAKRSPKELRRERAQLRKAQSAQTGQLKRTIAKAETQLAVFDVEQQKILAAMQSDEGATDYADLNRRLAVIQSEIQRYTQLWEDSAVELESVLAGDPSASID